VLKGVVARHIDYSDAQEIQRRLDGVTDCCTCANNEVRVNEMVKILEEEYISARDIYLWVIEVLQDARVSRSDLVPEISRRVPPGPGPVN
jgi:predicted nucleic-acid-binding protein